MNEVSRSVAIRRLASGADYRVELFRTELSNVANKTKPTPEEFIGAESHGVADAFVEHAMLLTGGPPKVKIIIVKEQCLRGTKGAGFSKAKDLVVFKTDSTGIL